MNKRIIQYIIGAVLCLEGVLLLLPCVIALLYRETVGVYYLACGLLVGLVGLMCVRTKPKNTIFYAREGFVAVALSWIILSLIGAMPLYLSGEIASFVDALFEVVSGFTTTGASIVENVETLSHTGLFWRSFTHWIGGMGVLVFILAIMPLTGGYNMHLMRAESPGPAVGKLVPHLRSTAKILYGIYLFMSAVEFGLLLVGGMPWFDALCSVFATAGTGGFGIRADSMASYSVYLQGVVTVFMILFGINFNVYYLFLVKKPKQALRSEEMRYYLLVIGISIALITWNIASLYGDLFTAFHHAAFQVGSIITTTGFATVDFNIWPTFSKTILVGLMFVGACAGSTGGGIKVSRFIVLVKTIKKELEHFIHPRSVRVIRLEDKPVEHTVLRAVNVFLVSYMLIFAVSVVLISLDNFDFTTNFTAVAATLNNIGPGLEMVGPAGNFADFSILSKFVLMFDMLAGRLEIFPLLLLFRLETWKK